MRLLDGKYVSEKLKGEIAEGAAEILAKTGRKPHLVAVLVGHDGGSETYVASKIKIASRLALNLRWLGTMIRLRKMNCCKK
jgi:5,10-methylene-tetrahydrofolate dehydrogenase/methenyl tetrahydrofolate cyclohydrolase